MRQSGILLHISSLPGPYGIGSLGKEAFAFVDFLKESGQSIWQILPLGPTSFGDSPYQSLSSFAGNPYFIDIDQLLEKGLLTPSECEQAQMAGDFVRYGLLFDTRFALLHKAFLRALPTMENDRAFALFCQENAWWLDDWALYMAIKQHRQMAPWYLWERPLRKREAQALQQAGQEYEQDVLFHRFLQFLFYEQWDALKAYANQNGVQILGDVPIYVAHDSCDVWANSEIFELDEELMPKRVAGVPPDYFSQTGQLWGNPLYRWDVLKGQGYRYWVRRMRHAFGLYDWVRIDHFRGFAAYWAVPYGEETAQNGCWEKGPGEEFFAFLRRVFPKLPIIAEDLGILTQEVYDLLAKTGFAGMKVLQFAFDSDANNAYLPHNFASPHCVLYTGTHDNDTLQGFLDSAGEEKLRYIDAYCGISHSSLRTWGLLATGMRSTAQIFMAQMQDYLSLGSQYRMNIPSSMGDNWCFRLQKGQLTEGLAKRIAHMTQLFGRA